MTDSLVGFTLQRLGRLDSRDYFLSLARVERGRLDYGNDLSCFYCIAIVKLYAYKPPGYRRGYHKAVVSAGFAFLVYGDAQRPPRDA
jgi:hypothetical protein